MNPPSLHNNQPLPSHNDDDNENDDEDKDEDKKDEDDDEDSDEDEDNDDSDADDDDINGEGMDAHFDAIDAKLTIYEDLLNEAHVLFPEQYGLDNGIVLDILSFV